MKCKSVFVGDLCYTMPSLKRDSDGNIKLIHSLRFGPLEVFIWGINSENKPYELYKWCENDYYEQENYCKNISIEALKQKISYLIKLFRNEKLTEWVEEYEKILVWLESNKDIG